MEFSGGSPRADHLCVLIHGLWGNPNHMRNVAKALRERYGQDELHIYLAKRNSDSFTYDGIGLGGERVCAEIVEELRAIEEKGGKITKLSIVGYSMGGLIGRYVVGLLYAKGILDSVQCMNFVTFATPHLGVRTPLKGWLSYFWNFLGARIISASGQQLFLVDDFHGTGRPLLAVMSEPDSIFMAGLRKFQKRALYSNIVNDRTAPYFTTCIEKTDPYRDNVGHLKINFVKGYDGLILSAPNAIMPRPKAISAPATLPSTVTAALGLSRTTPLMIAVYALLPIGVVMALFLGGVQTLRSSRRIRLHPKEAGFNVDEYSFPILIQQLQGRVEHTYSVLNNSQDQAFLGSDEDEDEEAGLTARERGLMARERRLSQPAEPTLALAPSQFEMVRSLNELGWRKFPVWIRKNRHSHAGIIVRMDKESFSEGWSILSHFAHDEFVLA